MADLNADLLKLLEKNIDAQLYSTSSKHQWTVTVCEEVITKYVEVNMLTVSTYLMRLVLLLYFNRDDKTKQFVSDSLGCNPASLTREAFNDYILEFGNSICGSIKRDLGKCESHLGMSTPNLLGGGAIHVSKYLKSDFGAYVNAQESRGGQMGAALLLEAYGEFDLSPAVTVSEDESSLGELEFF